jgi:hypothetical protein
MLYNIIVILTRTLIMSMTFLASSSIKQHQTSLALTILQTEELDNNFGPQGPHRQHRGGGHVFDLGLLDKALK